MIECHGREREKERVKGSVRRGRGKETEEGRRER